MSRKKIWTFASVCRAARNGRKWRVTKRDNVRCEDGRCPLGAAFPGFGRIPDDVQVDGLPYDVVDAIMQAADTISVWDDNTVTRRNRARMLKLLGIAR